MSSKASFSHNRSEQFWRFFSLYGFNCSKYLIMSIITNLAIISKTLHLRFCVFYLQEVHFMDSKFDSNKLLLNSNLTWNIGFSDRLVDAVEFINNEFELVLFVICLYVGNILNILRKLVEVLWEEPNFVAFSEYMNFTISRRGWICWNFIFRFS